MIENRKELGDMFPENSYLRQINLRAKAKIV